MNTKLLESREMEIFRELVGNPNKKRDEIPPLGDARAAVAERHQVSLETVIGIERKGVARNWPPLD
jgi:hypothetical protein